MLLKSWIFKEDMSKAEFARKLGLDRSTLTQYFNGYRRFSSNVCEKIEEITNGEVTRTEAMWPELYDPSWKYKKRTTKRGNDE